jgi:hypothetical protein
MSWELIYTGAMQFFVRKTVRIQSIVVLEKQQANGLVTL